MGADKSKDLRLSPLELPLPCMYIGRRQLDIGAHLRERICEGGEKGMIQLQPLHDRVVIKRIEETEKTRSGLFIPDTAKEKPQQGEVIAVGDGQILESGKRIPLDLKVGDRVLFGKYAGTDVIIDDEEYLIMRENEIFGRIGKVEKTKTARK